MKDKNWSWRKPRYLTPKFSLTKCHSNKNLCCNKQCFWKTSYIQLLRGKQFCDQVYSIKVRLHKETRILRQPSKPIERRVSGLKVVTVLLLSRFNHIEIYSCHLFRSNMKPYLKFLRWDRLCIKLNASLLWVRAWQLCEDYQMKSWTIW